MNTMLYLPPAATCNNVDFLRTLSLKHMRVRLKPGRLTSLNYVKLGTFVSLSFHRQFQLQIRYKEAIGENIGRHN